MPPVDLSGQGHKKMLTPLKQMIYITVKLIWGSRLRFLKIKQYLLNIQQLQSSCKWNRTYAALRGYTTFYWHIKTSSIFAFTASNIKVCVCIIVLRHIQQYFKFIVTELSPWFQILTCCLAPKQWVARVLYVLNLPGNGWCDTWRHF